MIIEVNPNNSTDLYSLASQKQQVIQSHVLTIASTSWVKDSTLNVWKFTANFSPDFGAEVGLFDNPNLIASYTIPQGDMTNYDKCSSCNVRVASIVLPTPGASNYSAEIMADLQPDINVSLDLIIYGRNDSVGDKATDTVSRYIIEHCIALYQPSFAYKVGNMCYQDGVLYKCIANTTGNIPPNSTYWVRFDQDVQNRLESLEKGYASLVVSGTVMNSQLGTANIGANNKFMYLVAGAPIASNLTLGNSSTPIYVNSGVFTACSNVVNTDGSQTISGEKTFTGRVVLSSSTPRVSNRNEETLQIQRNDLTLGSITSDTGMHITYYGGGSYQTSERIATLRSYMRTNGHNTFYVSQFYKDGETLYSDGVTINVGSNRGNFVTVPTPITNALNDATVPTMAYLNDPEKATYLVHRAGTETITGVKTFSGADPAINIKNSVSTAESPAGFATLRYQQNDGLTVGNLYADMTANGRTSMNLYAQHFASNKSKLSQSVLSVVALADGSTYATCPTPTDSAPNTAIVTKDYSKVAKAVTTDEAQTITGAKTMSSPSNQFRGAYADLRRGSYGTNLVLGRSDVSIAESTGNTTFGFIDWNDKDNANFGDVNVNITKNPGTATVGGEVTPYTSVRITAKSPSGANPLHGIEIYTGDNNKTEVIIPDVPTGAGSRQVTTKAYVESTDGVTNNLVHRTSDEKINGIKTTTASGMFLEHGRLMRGGNTATTMNTNKFYRIIECGNTAGDARVVVSVTTLNSWGVVRVSQISGAVTAENAVGNILSAVNFTMETSGGKRNLYVSKSVAGDIIVQVLNFNVNGVNVACTPVDGYEVKA